MPHRAPHRLGGHPFPPLGASEGGGNLPIGDGLAAGDLQQHVPHRQAEGGAAGGQRRGEVRNSPLKVPVEPPPGLLKDRQIPLMVLGIQGRGEVFSPVEPEAAEVLPVA